jgi:hypothetical protein
MRNHVRNGTNDEPWEPLPGMSKLRCTDCRYWFAAPNPHVERCPDCVLRSLRQRAESDRDSDVLRPQTHLIGRNE